MFTSSTQGSIADHVQMIGLSDLGSDVTIAKSLPPSLRTNHWYCDLHHALFLILLVNAAKAVEENKPRLAEYFIDTLTIYWVEHSLMEEEGMALSLTKGMVDPAAVERHARSHVGLTRWWWNAVVTPFKDPEQDTFKVRDTLHQFYRMVVQHIQEFDQPTYGTASEHTPASVCYEVAHLANSGLPLAPQMPGTADLLKTLAPYMSKTLSKSALSPQAKESGKPLTLTATNAPLWTGGKGAFHDIISRTQGFTRLAA